MNHRILNKMFSLVQYASDFYIHQGSFVRYMKVKKPYLILAGNIGYPTEETYSSFLLHTSYYFDKVFVIPGELEYEVSRTSRDLINIDNQIENICQRRNNLFFLQKKTHLLCEINNIEIAGCTLFTPPEQYLNKFFCENVLGDMSFQMSNNYHHEHFNWLYKTVNNNMSSNFIIATHNLPFYKCLNNKNLINSPKDETKLLHLPNLFMNIHGNTLINKNYYCHETFIVTNQHGFKEKPLENYDQ